MKNAPKVNTCSIRVKIRIIRAFKCDIRRISVHKLGELGVKHEKHVAGLRSTEAKNMILSRDLLHTIVYGKE